MQTKQLEPGILQVFRWYAILRITLLGFFFVGQFFVPFERRGESIEADPLPYILFVFAEMLLLLGYLSWPWLRARLGQMFLPLGLTFATLGLILEQYVVGPFGRFWPSDPFFFVLLILLAWQYSFRAVLFFLAGTLGLELALNAAIPPQDLNVYRFGPMSQNTILYARLFGRSVMLLMIGFVTSRLMRFQREQRKALAEANRKLVQNAAALEQLTISRERNRMSRELHDTLAHTLSALAVQLDAVYTVWQDIPAKARAIIEQMLDTTRSGLDETRRALSALRAAPLEEMGLALAVRSLAEDLSARHALSLELDIPDQIDNLSPEIEQSVYRIAQEALENIARHANARQVRVDLGRENGRIKLTVSDDGQGFDMAAKEIEDKFGLQGMQERAEYIGADFQVHSQPSHGTTVRLTLEDKR